MEEWLSYRPADFLMFSDRTYWRLFALENAALMPLPVLAPVIAGLASLLAWFRPAIGIPALAVLLAAGWALSGGSFVWQRYAPINWPMAYFAPFFAAQAFVLLAAAAGGGSRHGRRDRAAGATGFVLLTYAIVLHPLTGMLSGRPITGAEIVGIAPDPTAIATLGFGLLLPAGGRRVLVLAFPATWLAVSAMTLWLLGAREVIVPAGALLVTAGALVLRARSR